MFPVCSLDCLKRIKHCSIKNVKLNAMCGHELPLEYGDGFWVDARLSNLDLYHYL